MKFFALLSSMPFESNKILRQFKNARRIKLAGKTVYKGKLLNTGILLMNTGIGKANAALCATGLIERFPITSIINLGAGGAYPASGLKVGDIAVASKEIYGEEGVISSGGWESLKKIGIPLVQSGNKKYFNEFPLDGKLAKKTLSLLSRITQCASQRTMKKIPPYPPLPKGGGGDFKIKSGIFVTVSAATGTHKRALELERRFNAVCENMEGAAIAQVCTVYKVPMLEIRGISNIAGVRDKRKWNLKLASENCQRAVLCIIESLHGCLSPIYS
ncbi:MAG: futalosine hydrolase [Nitrospirota bacterium]